MVAAARERGIEATEADVATWTPDGDVGVVVTNAVLQWVPGHRALLQRWVEALPDGGWLAMQVPGNFTAPSHELARAVAERFGVPLRDAATVAEPEDYADDLTAAGADTVDVWETTYLQRLTGDDPVLHWISGTALRPVRDALSDADWSAYVAELAPLLREAYPQRADGSTWFPFRRIFALGARGS
jgi:trans-aconitate 2-methyltransferase